MKVLNYSYSERLKLGVLDTQFAKAMLNFADEIVIWAEGYKCTVEHSILGKKAVAVDSFPLFYDPDIVFFLTHSSEHILFNLDWADKPKVVFWADKWAGTWKGAANFLKSVANLGEKVGNMHYWAVSKGAQEEIKEITGRDALLILGRVPDEVFLFPEEHLVKPQPKRNVILWAGNLVNKRTITAVWDALLKAFPDHFLVFADPTIEAPPVADRRAIVYKGLRHMKTLRLMGQSKVVVAPYKREIPYISVCNPVKYWEAVSLNIPVVATNAPPVGHGMLSKVCDNDNEAAEFVVETVRKVLKGDIPPPFSDPDELRKFRQENSFTEQIRRALQGVLKC